MSTAQRLIENCAQALQDVQGIRWSASQLVNFLNDAQRELVLLRPDVMARELEFVPQHGQCLQHVPDDVVALMEVSHNTTGRQQAIYRTTAPVLDAVERAWRGKPASAQVQHYVYDLKRPREFWLYPAPAEGVKVALVAAVYPKDIPAPAAGVSSFEGVGGEVDVPAQWHNALREWVLFRAWSVDAEFGGNAQLAQTHHQLFLAAVSQQLQSSATVAA